MQPHPIRKSASCTHVSGLLHALVSLAPSEFQLPGFEENISDDEVLPITSYACQWKIPRKRKESALHMSEATFHKHVYGRERKRNLKPLETFDPRPSEFKGTAGANLPTLLDKVRGKGLAISLLLDPKTRCWSGDTSTAQPMQLQLPCIEDLRESVAELKKSLQLPAEKCREIELKTRDQSLSSLWFSVRRYRITASYFGVIYRRLPTTPPHSLVLQILGSKPFTSVATDWGKKSEPVALKLYVQHQHSNGHDGLYACSSGFVISEDHPFLGASPDAAVHDPTEADQFGVVEIKCPYSCRQVTPAEACLYPKFCCALDAKGIPTLRREHIYYAQIQGQMGVTKRKWCDFVIYTEKGINIERIKFDCDFWEKDLVPKLTKFFDNCLGPEIVSPVHVLGLKVRDLMT